MKYKYNKVVGKKWIKELSWAEDINRVRRAERRLES
jgi:hypothetical protein